MTPPLLTDDPTAIDGTSTFVQALRDVRDDGRCGGKAARLAQLTRLGFQVPAAFVITSEACREVLERHGLAPYVLDVDDCGAPPLASAATAIRQRILGIRIAGPLRTAICDAARALGGGPLIARSSGCGEDGTAASFAGQFDSIADLWSDDDLLGAVVRVWSSRWSPRVLGYARATGASLRGMGVVVQRQISARWSGVLFTESPDRGDEMLLEFCAGSGEALVSGRINPGRVTIRRSDLRWSLTASPEGAPDTPDRGSNISGDTLTSLARTGRAIEQVFSAPQDIEWVIDSTNQAWVVQSRPITARRVPPGLAAPPATAPHPAADVVWSNANVNENFPDPITPLLYSIARNGYYHYFRNLGRAFGISNRRLEAMEQPLREIIGVHHARMYYNLTSIHAVLRSAPGGALLAASFDQFVGAPATDTAAAVPFATRARASLTTAIEVARIAVQTTWQYLCLRRRVARFEGRIDAFAARTDSTGLATRSPDVLLLDLRAFLDIRRHRWNDAALADAGSMVCYGLLQRALTRAFPDADRHSLHNSLLTGLPDLVSGKPALALWELASQVRSSEALTALFRDRPDDDVLHAVTTDAEFSTFALALADFQDQWGFRCSGELMLTRPSYQEDPRPLIALIRSYSRSSGEPPATTLDRQAAARLAETARVRRELRARPLVRFVPGRLQAAAVMRLLGWTQTCICLRERARLKQALLYTRLRHVALTIGARLVADGRLASADDVFFLPSDELEALLDGSAMFPDQTAALVAMRREAHLGLSTVTPPDRLTLRRGEYCTGHEGPSRDEASSASGLLGLGACGGLATGRATMLEDVREAHRLRAGDVLVTRQTDPGWGPVFPLLAGLVIERGGMLSHGAIIAREFGIPAVIGVRDATRLIPDGRRVIVDGNRGIVSLEPAS
ncbi:MAG: PEP/pyruvate-binding domain-containing protein [Vicinamibacterales bacterium]